jgi:hypothetical protein
MPCKPNIHPANSIRHAYSRYEYVSANIFALSCYFRHYYWRCDYSYLEWAWRIEGVKWSKCGDILDRRSGVKFVPPIISVMPYKKNATLRLFVMTMPIYKAVATGNGNIESNRETAHSNLK